jgi:DNA-binding protein HU-beta
MNKQELIKHLTETAAVSKTQAENVVNELANIAHEELATGNEFTLPGFGKFTKEYRAARIGRNPSTGAELEIAAKYVPKFSAAKALKDAVAE